MITVAAPGLGGERERESHGLVAGNWMSMTNLTNVMD